MATTAVSLIEQALRINGALPGGQSARAHEITDGLTYLNNLLGSWRTEELLVPVTVLYEHDLSPVPAESNGEVRYTIGPGGQLDQPRPTPRIPAAAVVSGSQLHPLVIYETSIDWQRVRSGDYATLAGRPRYLLDQRGNDAAGLGWVQFWPTPGGGERVQISTPVALEKFPDPQTAIEFADGYERALVFALAIEMAPEYGRPISQDTKDIARMAKSMIKRVNQRTPRLRSDLADLVGHSSGLGSHVGGTVY